MFQRLGIKERTQILDKIHKMRLKAFDRREFENLIKPHMPMNNPGEKEKIIEQYYMAKRQLKGMSPRPTHEGLTNSNNEYSPTSRQ